MNRLDLSSLLLGSACGLSACCLTVGGNETPSNSLQGANSFSPNATFAVLEALDGGAQTFVIITLSNSTPPFACSNDAENLPVGVPDAGVVGGLVEVAVLQSGGVAAGTFDLSNPDTAPEIATTAGMAFVRLYGTASATAGRFQAASLSGTVTLTKVGDEWAGSFDATMLSGEDEQSALSGTFDTTALCYEAQ